MINVQPNEFYHIDKSPFIKLDHAIPQRREPDEEEEAWAATRQVAWEW